MAFQLSMTGCWAHSCRRQHRCASLTRYEQSTHARSTILHEISSLTCPACRLCSSRPPQQVTDFDVAQSGLG